jgi:outer membrane protein assembly factor BamB
MTREHQHRTEEEILDQQWDALVTGRVLVAEDPIVRELHAAPGPAAPTPMFKNQLRSMLEMAAQDQAGDHQSSQIRADDSMLPVTAELPLRPVMRPAVHRPGRMRGLSRAGKMVSVLLAASLLVAIAGAMIRYPFSSSNGTGAPTNQPQGTSIAAVSSPVVPSAGEMASSADPGRTNQQPGPAPIGIPEIVGHADISGDRMALGGDTIVIVDSDTVTAFDADTLEHKWSVEVPYGVYTAPVIAGDAVYFGFTGQREGTTEWLLGPDQPNQLVSLSLKDGSENWRIDGAGSYPAAPLVVNGTIYAVGTTTDDYQLGAYEPEDGSMIWTAEPFDSIKTDGYPEVIPYLWMSLAYSDSVIVVNQMRALSAFDIATGKDIWSQTVETPDTIDAPIISNGFVIAKIGHSPMKDDEIGSGRVAAFDLRTGGQQWSSDLETGISWSQAVGNGTVIRAQVGQANEYLLTAFDVQSGDVDWSVPSWDSAADPGPDFAQLPDTAVTVGKQIVTVGVASTRGDHARTLVTVRDLVTGDIAWSVIMDGITQTAPIIADGKVYVLTDFYGLQVLGDNPDAMAATPESNVADLRDPLTCAYEPTESPFLGTPTTDRTPVPAFDRIYAPMSPGDVPIFNPGHAVSQEVTDSIQQRLDQYRDCTIMGDPTRLFDFFSADYYLRLQAMGERRFDGRNGESGEMAVRIGNDGTQRDISDLQVLPDGRIGGIVGGDVHAYFWFVLEDGVYKIDEMHGIADRPDLEESPSPEE